MVTPPYQRQREVRVARDTHVFESTQGGYAVYSMLWQYKQPLRGRRVRQGGSHKPQHTLKGGKALQAASNGVFLGLSLR